MQDGAKTKFFVGNHNFFLHMKSTQAISVHIKNLVLNSNKIKKMNMMELKPWNVLTKAWQE